MSKRIGEYRHTRDRLDVRGTSGLSENLTYGEISPRTCWLAGHQAMMQGLQGAETFLKELAWREFAYHLALHTPHIVDGNWRESWNGFPWTDSPDLVRPWTRGQTGIEVIDAAMRELYVTGTMHNRARMLVASFLTKNLLIDWRVGQQWFADCLVDWDPASNAMGWQWTAGSGPDAAPYFRIFNPESQAEKFDPQRTYRSHWLDPQGKGAAEFFQAIPKSWKMSPDDPYPSPMVDLAGSRARALDAYDQMKHAAEDARTKR